MSADAGRPERAASVASSSTETGTHDENEKLAKLDQTEEGMSILKDHDLDDGITRGDQHQHEEAQLLPNGSEKPEPPPKNKFMVSFAWMVVNTLATIAIVRSLPESLMYRAADADVTSS